MTDTDRPLSELFHALAETRPDDAQFGELLELMDAQDTMIRRLEVQLSQGRDIIVNLWPLVDELLTPRRNPWASATKARQEKAAKARERARALRERGWTIGRIAKVLEVTPRRVSSYLSDNES